MEDNLFQKLQSIVGDLSLILPEFLLVALIILVLLFDLLLKEKSHWMRVLVIIGLLLELYLVSKQYLTFSKSVLAFSGMITINSLAAFWKMLFALGGLLTLSMSTRKIEPTKIAEYFIFILSIMLGANLLAMSSNLLMIYLSLEVISISSYILTTFSFDKKSTEAGIKYLLFGAVASAVMIYGMSLLYAITLTLDFTSQLFTDSLLEHGGIAIIVGSIMILAGFIFKIAAAPLHIWSPDVYTAAPTPVVAFFSIVPKLAGFAILIKAILVLNLFGLGPIEWPTVLSILAMLTILIGNFSAIWQTNIKRLLAYSSIAHSGFLLAGFAAFSETALENVLFYSCVYLIMNISIFMIANHFEKSQGLTTVEDYTGLIKANPFLTVLITILLVSLAGLPPTGGFTAKLLIFTSIWESYSQTDNQWLLYLLAFGLLNTVVSLFYYLKIPYYMIFKTAKSEVAGNEINFDFQNYLSAVLVLAVLLIFFKPDWLMSLINNINFAF